MNNLELARRLRALHPADLAMLVVAFPDAAPYVSANAPAEKVTELIGWATKFGRLVAVQEALGRVEAMASGGVVVSAAAFQATPPPDRGECQSGGECDGSRHAVLRQALVDMGILSAGSELPDPYLKTSGVAGVSHVWFLLLQRPNGAELQIVAKFDETTRARREWERIGELRNLNTPLQAMLPLSKNKPEHGVVIYQNANALTLSGEASTLQTLLRRQLLTNPDNCLRALELSLDALRLFYNGEPGALRFSAGGRVMKWTDWLPPQGTCMPGMLSGARMAFPSVSAEQKDFTVLDGVLLPNPLPVFWGRAAAPQGKNMVSRIHGDLNLTNVLVGLSQKHAPVDIFIIDLAACEADAPTAIDLARMETEFWHEVFPELVEEERGNVDEAVVAARNLLDIGIGCLSSVSPAVQNAARFVDALRQSAVKILGGGRPDYVLADYMQALYFLHGRALAFSSVQRSSARCKAAFLGASFALAFLNRLERGQVVQPPVLQPASTPSAGPRARRSRRSMPAVSVGVRDGAVALGNGSVAVGKGGITIGGNVHGNIGKGKG